jgi:hypothetical protein
MAFEFMTVSKLGSELLSILNADAIVPGSTPSYQMCKTIYLFHPLGAKIAEKPVSIAQSQERELACPDSPEDDVLDAFQREWERMRATQYAYNTRVQSRIYGIASISLMVDGEKTDQPVDFWALWKSKISFNVYDPLNTAGSLVLNQDPLAMDFQHAQEIRVNNATFHRSRSRVIMNEFPIYIEYQPSTFGFSGRSVYQRSLYPLKSFIQTMVTNDMVSVKAGVIVAKIKQYGAVITNTMLSALGFKRNVVKEAVVGNVINVTPEESIESLDLKNLSEPFKLARSNIIEDIAAGTPMPAKMLTEESFSTSFAEGSEDAREQARYIDRERQYMQPIYDFLTEICMFRAWNPDFIDLMKKKHKRLHNYDYKTLFYQWKDSFKAEWPNLLTEPDSEKVKVDDVKLRAMISVVQLLMPRLKGEQFALAVEWLADNINDMKLLFSNPLVLDYKMLAEDFDELTESEEAESIEPKEKKTTVRGMRLDSSDRKLMASVEDFQEAVARLRQLPDIVLKDKKAS